MIKSIEAISKKIAFKFLGIGAPNYPYLIEPIQLSKIISSLELLKNTNGSIAEVGVARGMTSFFIAHHMEISNYNSKFYCIDTFSSFEKEDLNYEVSNRNKAINDLTGFEYNDFKVWGRNFKKFDFVIPIKSDIKKLDLKVIAPIKFVFIDVDLYQPTKHLLDNIQPHLSEKAIIMIDDLLDDNKWDGGYQAVREFIDKNKYLKLEKFGNKGGLIKFGF